MLARLGLARAHAWQGRPAEAKAQCEAALAALEPSPVPRYVLQVRCLAAALDGDGAAAVAALARPRSRARPTSTRRPRSTSARGWSRTERPTIVIRRYLALSAELPHRGIRYHVEDLRSALYARVGDTSARWSASRRRNRELDHLLEPIEGDYRSQMASHTWVQAMRQDEGAALSYLLLATAPSPP